METMLCISQTPWEHSPWPRAVKTGGGFLQSPSPEGGQQGTNSCSHTGQLRSSRVEVHSHTAPHHGLQPEPLSAVGSICDYAGSRAWTIKSVSDLMKEKPCGKRSESLAVDTAHDQNPGRFTASQHRVQMHSLYIAFH